MMIAVMLLAVFVMVTLGLIGHVSNRRYDEINRALAADSTETLEG